MENVEPQTERERLLQYLRAKADAQNTAAPEMAAIQQQISQQQALAGMAEGANTILQGALGNKADPNAFASAKTANQQVLQDYLGRRKAERDQEYDKFQAVKEMADLEQSKERQAIADARAKKEMALLNKPQLRVDPATGKLAKFIQGNFAGYATPEDKKSVFFDTLDPNKKKIFTSIESQTASNPEVKTAASSLATIQQIEPKLLAAEQGDTGQLASAVNNAARAIGGEKGVMTDRDVLRASGLPADWYGKTSDQILTQIGQLDQTQQLQTLKNMVHASKLTYNKQLQSANNNAKAKAKLKGIEVPEDTNFLPVSVSPLEIAPQVSLAPTPQGAVDKVRVKNPEGKIGLIPASQLESALKKGFTKVE